MELNLLFRRFALVTLACLSAISIANAADFYVSPPGNFDIGAEEVSSADVGGNLVQWQPLQFSFSGPFANESDNSPNPFLDYRLQVTFDGPSGQTYLVPGFFDGDGASGGSGTTWRVRFAPDEAGPWTYSASFRSGSNVAINLDPAAGTATGFDGESGGFTITALDSGAPGFLKWGRLEYVGKHHLKFRDGAPVATNTSANSMTDNIGAKGGATYVYKVCATGSTSNCSNTVTVVF